MDALSDVLRVVGLTGGVFIEAEFTDPWSVAGRVEPELFRPYTAQPTQVVAFHYVVEGGFELRIGDDPGLIVSAGEAVMLPHNDLHVFGNPGSRKTAGIGELIQGPDSFGVSRVEHGGGGARTRLVCGFMGGSDQLGPLLSTLPRAMKIDVAGMPGGEWMGRTLTHAAETLRSGDPGAATVLAKLAELLFVECLRSYLAGLPPEQTGWLAGLRDPVIAKALALLHGQVNAGWTAEALALEVNMSRSAFADRFTAVVGQPPMRYLTAWRMQLARRSLLASQLTIAQIAFEVGYESEAAFSRAFRRDCGSPPGAWRRKAAA